MKPPLELLRALFISPQVLLGGAALAVLVAAVAMLSRRRATARQERLLSTSLAAKSRLLPVTPPGAVALTLLVVASLGVAAALARPRWGKSVEAATRQGSDVIIVMDTSSSMRAADVSPSRFVLARQAAVSLLPRLTEDRLALVSMEGEAQALVPLTLDASAVALFLDAMEPGMGNKPGSSLASGISTAVELFSGAAVAGKSCVLISDGEDLEGGVEEAIARAKAEGVVVHTVLVGSKEGRGAPVPDVDAAGRVVGYKQDEGSPVLSRANPDILRQLAAQTGGVFSVVSPGRTDLEGVASAIDKSARRPLSGTVLSSQEERFQIPLAVAVTAIGLLLLGAGHSWPTALFARKEKGVAKAAVAALLVICLLPLVASAQQPPSAGAPAPEPKPAPAPPPAPATLKERLLSGPPFKTARGEALSGKKALEEKRNEQAVEHFAREVQLAPKDLTGAYNLGTALAHAGRGEEALSALDAAKRSGRRSLAADAAYNSGEVLYRSGKYEEAARSFRECVKLAPGDADAAWNYELCRRQQQEQEQKQKQQQKQQDKNQAPTPTPDPKNQQKQKQEKEDREFEQKAKMSKEKAEQLLAAIQQSDLDEQKKKIAEQRSRRRVARDW